jgi:hypothetical protein
MLCNIKFQIELELAVMEDGMDFSPQRHSNEHNRNSFGNNDGYEFTTDSITPKQQSANSQGKKSTKPSHGNTKATTPVPAHSSSDHAAGPTAAVAQPLPAATTPVGAGNNTEQQSASNQESGGGNRSNSIESSSGATPSSAATHVRRHTGGDSRWDAIQMATSRDAPLNLCHFRLLKRLGYGDIGSVYLVELRGTLAFFAMKVMDKASIISRNKMARAQTEREILGLLDHPFLPTLFTHFETDKFYCLVMEYCSGGNLHSLRQKQPGKHFTEPEARSVFHHIHRLLAGTGVLFAINH